MRDTKGTGNTFVHYPKGTRRQMMLYRVSSINTTPNCSTDDWYLKANHHAYKCEGPARPVLVIIGTSATSAWYPVHQNINGADIQMVRVLHMNARKYSRREYPEQHERTGARRAEHMDSRQQRPRCQHI